MDYVTLAKMIPAEYRKEILQTNMINQAAGVATDKSMFYLYTIWKQYVDATVGDCALCINRVLDHYRKLQPTFIELARSENLLDNL